MKDIIIDRFSKEELANIVKQCYCLKDVVRALGYKAEGGNNNWTVRKRLQEYGIDTSHFRQKSRILRTDEELFVENSKATQIVVRKRFKAGNYQPYQCSICDQKPFWNGQPLIMILDHINGNHSDHRLANLRWVCPNCNSQLKTTGFTGIRKYDEVGSSLSSAI